MKLAAMEGSFETFNVTGICCAPLPAPTPVTVTAPVYDPGASPAGLTEMLSGPGVVPVVGATSHAWPSAVETNTP